MPSALKVVTILGTRPEIIRLSRVLALLDQETNHILVHTGQNSDYELNEVFFRDLKSPPAGLFSGDRSGVGWRDPWPGADEVRASAR